MVSLVRPVPRDYLVSRVYLVPRVMSVNQVYPLPVQRVKWVNLVGEDWTVDQDRKEREATLDYPVSKGLLVLREKEGMTVNQDYQDCLVLQGHRLFLKNKSLTFKEIPPFLVTYRIFVFE